MDVTISEIPQVTTLDGDDLLLVSKNNNDGTYVSKSIKYSNLQNNSFGKWISLEGNTDFTICFKKESFSDIQYWLFSRYISIEDTTNVITLVFPDSVIFDGSYYFSCDFKCDGINYLQDAKFNWTGGFDTNHVYYLHCYTNAPGHVYLTIIAPKLES